MLSGLVGLSLSFTAADCTNNATKSTSASPNTSSQTASSSSAAKTVPKAIDINHVVLPSDQYTKLFPS